MIIEYKCIRCKKDIREKTAEDGGGIGKIKNALCPGCSVAILREHLENNSIGGMGSGARKK